MLKYFLLCVVACASYWVWVMYPIKHGSGETAPQPPTFEFIRAQEPILFQNNTLVPLKKFSGQVRVLHKKRYFFDSRKNLAPVDLLIGWGQMSDERNIDFIHFSLADRTASMNYIRPPIPEEEIFGQMELLHLIASTEVLEKKIRSLRIGNTIQLEGYYVNVHSISAKNWNTNSENKKPIQFENIILWVTSLEVL